MVHTTQDKPVPLRQWRNVMFSDESRYLLYRADCRQRVYRRNGECCRDNCLVGRDRFGGGVLMVWAGISYGHRTPLVFIDGPLMLSVTLTSFYDRWLCHLYASTTLHFNRVTLGRM